MADNLRVRREIAFRLRQARENAGYTSAEAFCEKHQLSLETYLRHESGDVNIKASAAIRYCKLLKLPLTYLLLGNQLKQDDRTK